MSVTDPSSIELVTPSATMLLKNNVDMIALADAGILGSDNTGIYVFQGTDNNRPFRNVEGTGMCSVVVSSWQSSMPGSRFSSAQFVTLQVVVFADESRGVGNTTVAHDAQSKAFKVYNVFDSIFHDNQNINKNWWGLDILDSSRQSVGIYSVDGEDNLYALQAQYNVTVY